MIRIARTATAGAAIAGAIGAALIGLGAGQVSAHQAYYGCNGGDTIVDSVVTTNAAATVCEPDGGGIEDYYYVGVNRNTGAAVTIPNIRYDSALGLRSYTATASDGTEYLVLPDRELKIFSPSGAVIFDEDSIYS